jgi:putative colanic acid biosynthesis glycosyltransferase WcaI
LPKLKILFFTDHFRPEPSAPAAHIFERCRLWVAGGHQVTVITSAPNFPEGTVYPGYRNSWHVVEVMDGVRVVRVKTYITRNEGFVRRILDYLSYMCSSFWMAFGEPKPDVIISSSPHLFVAYAGCLHAILRRIPHVIEVRDLWPASLLENAGIRPGLTYRILERSELMLYRRSARVIALSPAIADDIVARGIPRQKVDTIINGANLELFTPRPVDRAVLERFQLSGRFVVGYIGTIGLSHGLEYAIRAFRQLEGTPALLFIVGVGAAKEDLESLVRSEGIRNVVFAPRQLREDVPAHWSVCQVSLIHLRDAEVFRTVIPSKIFESMAMGLPIIYAGPQGPGADLVRHRGVGIVVPPEQPAQLAQAVQLLMTDDVRRREMAEASLKAAPDYSRQRQADESLASLQSAVAARASR